MYLVGVSTELLATTYAGAQTGTELGTEGMYVKLICDESRNIESEKRRRARVE